MLFALELVGYEHHPYCFTGTRAYFPPKMDQWWNRNGKPFISALHRFWDSLEAEGKCLTCYDTEAMSDHFPAVEQIAALIFKLPNAYLN